MSMFRSARAVIAGAAVIALAGCASASTSGAAAGGPAGGTSAGGTSAGGGAASGGSSPGGPGSTGTATPSATSNSFVANGSIPFPIAVGNTWIYQTVSSINNEHGLVTNKVVSVTPIADGHRVTMSSKVGVGQSATTTQQNYIFYTNGKIGYPVNQTGVSVAGSGVLWPNAAQAASGQAFHSVLRIKLSNAGASQYEVANVTVQGGGTQTVTVPAGTYQATLVNMTMVMKVGNFTTTAVLKTWSAPGTGPVKTDELIETAGKTTLTTTEELLTFTKG